MTFGWSNIASDILGALFIFVPLALVAAALASAAAPGRHRDSG